MLPNLPYYIALVFGLTTIATLFLFVNAIKNATTAKTQQQSTLIFAGLTAWLIVQSALSLSRIYSADTDAFPPKIMLFGILPTIFTILLLFATPKGRAFIDSLPIKNLTYLNIVRVPVEIVLLWLFLNKTIPELMTFEGQNFDIFSGPDCPIYFYFRYVKKSISTKYNLL